MMNGYKDMNDEVKSQNGAYDVMGDQTEKII